MLDETTARTLLQWLDHQDSTVIILFGLMAAALLALRMWIGRSRNHEAAEQLAMALQQSGDATGIALQTVVAALQEIAAAQRGLAERLDIISLENVAALAAHRDIIERLQTTATAVVDAADALRASLQNPQCPMTLPLDD